jgi:hypothetical protein
MSEVMSDSVRWVPDFSGLKAARAFEALETYTANLLNQPWRKEFREIKVSIHCSFPRRCALVTMIHWAAILRLLQAQRREHVERR